MGFFEKVTNHKDNETGVHVGEAYVIATQLIARYDTLELLEKIRIFVEDTDLIMLIEMGLLKTIMPQINKLENAMEHYHMPFPPRPPKANSLPANKEVMSDELIFRIIFSGTQSAIMVHAKAINACTNDSLRSMFTDFMNKDLQMQDSLIKYGKLKGWIRQMPQYKQ